MQPIVTDVASPLVCLSVCLTVTILSRAKRLNQSRCPWVVNSTGSKELSISWEVQIPQGKGQFWVGKGRPIVKNREYCPCFAVAMRPVLSNYFDHMFILLQLHCMFKVYLCTTSKETSAALLIGVNSHNAVSVARNSPARPCTAVKYLQ